MSYCSGTPPPAPNSPCSRATPMPSAASFSRPTARRWPRRAGTKPFKLWDVASRTQKAALTGHTQQVTCTAFSPRESPGFG